MEKLLTVEDVSRILGVRPNTVHNRKWQLRTRCPLRKIGKRSYVLPEEFNRWLKEGEKA